MKNQRLNLAKSLLLSGALLLPLCRGMAAIVYNNTTTDLGKTYGPTNSPLEFGDQITLAGTDRILTDFSFYAFGGATPNQTFRLRLYSQDPTFGIPSTLLFDGAVQNLVPGFQTYTVSGLSLAVPDTFTWTVQFSGVDAGLLLYNPPTVGSSLNDFWQNSGGAWSLVQISDGTIANFAARVTAVPEPGTLALGALGFLLTVGFRLRRREP